MRFPNPKIRPGGLCIAGAFIVYATCAFASTETWSGGDNNDGGWQANANWEGIGGAGAGDDLVFQQVAQRKQCTNDFAVDTSFHSMTFTGNGYIIRGNELLLVAGISATVPDGVPPRFFPDIVLSANQAFSSSGATNYEVNGVVKLNGHTLTLSGAGDHQFDGSFSGTGSIIKNGAGTAIFDGTTAISGNTRIDGGTLQLIGTNGAVDLNGGTLAGEGTVTGAVTALALGGAIAPGREAGDAGILHVIGGVDLSATNATFQVDVNGSAGTQYDSLSVTGGTVDLSAANVSVSLGFSPTNGQRFTIIQHTGAGSVIGQFAQGTNVVVSGQVFTVTYSASNVVLAAPTHLVVTGISFQPGATGVVFSGIQGDPSAVYSVLATTNLSVPLTNWQVVASNVFDGAGTFSITNAINPSQDQQYLIIRSP